MRSTLSNQRLLPSCLLATFVTASFAAVVTGCSSEPIASAASSAASSAATQEGKPTVDVKIIAFNDLHGNLETPHLAIAAPGPDGTSIPVPAGGVAYLADAINTLKRANPNHAVVSAGDMIGASPLVSALFLDEPTIEAVNAIGIDFNAVGNHEFDKGADELLRMQNGGCTAFTHRQPCALNGSFSGAHFGFLAANTVRQDGSTLFPATGIKTFGNGASQVRIGFIGMTLKGTAHIVSPKGVAGLRFDDEATTANKLIPQLKAQGADAIVVLIHQGGMSSGGYNDHRCPDLSGDIVPILDRLDPAVDLVISGHTHRAYICNYDKRDKQATQPLLLTSAGQYGTLLTEINLTIDPASHKVIAKSANNLIVQSEGFTGTSGTAIKTTDLYPRYQKNPAVDAIVMRYAVAAAPLTDRVVARLHASVTRMPTASGESPLGNLVADAQLAATASVDRGGAQIALMNPGGIRANLNVPSGGGDVTYGQLFKSQPFGNNLVVKSFTGRQLRALLEQQFRSGGRNTSSSQLRVLFVSSGFTYDYDMRKPSGARVSNMRLHGKPVSAATSYRVAMNSYLAAGGDEFKQFQQGHDIAGGDTDVDALESYLRAHSPVDVPATNRIRRLDAPTP